MLEVVAFDFLLEIIECQDNDRKLRLKLAGNYIARLYEQIGSDLLIFWGNISKAINSEKEDEIGWESLDRVVDYLRDFVLIASSLENYSYPDIFLYLYDECAPIESPENEGFLLVFILTT